MVQVEYFSYVYACPTPLQKLPPPHKNPPEYIPPKLGHQNKK
jgi:hypothetical protein